MKLNRAKELPGYWNSDIYTAKLLEQSLDGFGPGQQALYQAVPGFNLEFSKGPGLSGSLHFVTSFSKSRKFSSMDSEQLHACLIY